MAGRRLALLHTLTETSPLAKVVGPAAARTLAANRGLETVGDLLEYAPRRYLEPGTLTDLGELEDGEDVVVVAEVRRATKRAMRNQPRKTMLTAVVTDGTHELDVTFFSAWGHDSRLTAGRRGLFAGTLGRYGGRWQLTHPEYELFEDDGASTVADYQQHLIPIYSSTGKIHTWRIRKAVRQALDTVASVTDPVPADILRRRSLADRATAIELLHRPTSFADAGVGRRRLRYDEAFILQTILAQRRRAAESVRTAAREPRPGGLLAAFDARLPFELTRGQREVGEQLQRELARNRPMHRLLQGEVGSGKTVVALRAMLTAIDSGGQSALLAPTEVLAAQHHRSITSMLGDLAERGMLGGAEVGTRVVLLTGSQTAAARRAALNAAVTGEAGLVIGTHALIQEHVEFFDLALVVVDEQHRFGVEQRDALRGKGKVPPHVLVMTATPIPRTVAMTVFGDMETSTLTELPSGRAPIATHVVAASSPRWVDRTWARVAEEVARGHQAYVVCPWIGEPPAADTLALGTDAAGSPPRGAAQARAREPGSPTAGAPAVPAATDTSDEESQLYLVQDEPAAELQSVYAVTEQLRADPHLASLRVEMLHGRMGAEAKDARMQAFSRGEVDVLVATTVIEVGVDVANATVMVILDAERFGISQLHQLRGRVGRGSAPGLCLLMSGVDSPSSLERLQAVAATSDGFVLARLDLEQRREGDVLGARQSGGRSSLKLLRLLRDELLIEQAREDAFALVAEDPELAAHPDLHARVTAALDEEQAAYLERG